MREYFCVVKVLYKALCESTFENIERMYMWAFSWALFLKNKIKKMEKNWLFEKYIFSNKIVKRRTHSLGKYSRIQAIKKTFRFLSALPIVADASAWEVEENWVAGFFINWPKALSESCFRWAKLLFSVSSWETTGSTFFFFNKMLRCVCVCVVCVCVCVCVCVVYILI